MDTCPDSTELLAWLDDAVDVEWQPGLAEHVDACASCQDTLERLCAAEGQGTPPGAADNLLEDLRRQPQADALEAEPECARGAELALEVGFASRTAAPRSDQREPTDLQPLSWLGPYQILGPLGMGGMGVVHKARHTRLDRLVALKVLPLDRTRDAAALARFEREMMAVGRLKHPHIVAAYDADVAAGTHFLVMEYIEGTDLKSLVRAVGPLSAARAIPYILQAARALQYAHSQGIVHRDVKPANLMLEPGGNVKVLDLGLAQIAPRGEVQADLTDSGMVVGTADYLAPEQAAGQRDTDGRADIYSLGCSLYFLLTGRPPYDGRTAIQKILAHREAPIPLLRDAGLEIPPSLQEVFARMVAKRPEDRYPSMAEVIDALERGRLGWTPSTLGEGRGAAPLSGSGAVRNWLRGRRGVLAATMAVLLLCALGLMLPKSVDTRGPAEDGSQTARRQDIPTPLGRGIRAGQEWNDNGLAMPLCWCPPGRFTMGSPRTEPGRAEFECPQVDVEFTRGFWLGRCEVTQEDWERVMGTRPSRFQGEKTLPVENVTWEDAVKFCETFTERDRVRGVLSQGWEYRLPTEAQWEYACRAGTSTAFSFGDTGESLSDYAWHAYNAELRTHEVGGKKPNPWGLHDMTGNVWEWCRDWFQNTLPGGVDPEVTAVGTGRVMRGGGWNAAASLCRTAFRTGQKPQAPSHLLGFRVAAVERELPPAPPTRPASDGHP